MHGTIWCWGRGDYGQIGNGLKLDRETPTKVTDTGVQFRASQANGPTIASGANHTCAISVPGNVWCWGSNYYGQLGEGQTPGQTNHNHNRDTPQQIPGLIGVVSLTAGENHTCARLLSNAVRCWGNGSSGQLGHGQAPSSSGPVTAQITGATVLTAGGNQTCAITTDGTLSCWGGRFDGRFFARQNLNDRRTPSPVANVTGVTAIALGATHACVTTGGGTVSCWGSSLGGQLGDGPMPGGHYPIQRTPAYVIGFEPLPAPPIGDPPSGPPHAPLPPSEPGSNPGATPPARPKPLTVELRDHTLALRSLTLQRAKKAKACPKTARATVSARISVRSGKRKAVRTVKTTRTIRLKKTKTACQTTATVKLKGQITKAKKVTLTITGKGLKTSKRTVKARHTATLQKGTLKLDRLALRSTNRHVCPTHATITIVGATKATKKHKLTKKRLPVRLAPTAGCHTTTSVKLTGKLRTAKKITLTVSGSGLRATKKTLKTG